MALLGFRRSHRAFVCDNSGSCLPPTPAVLNHVFHFDSSLFSTYLQCWGGRQHNYDLTVTLTMSRPWCTVSTCVMADSHIVWQGSPDSPFWMNFQRSSERSLNPPPLFWKIYCEFVKQKWRVQASSKTI